MFAPCNGTKLFWEGHGAGRPMLLMHGGPGLDHTYFRPWLDALGETVRLIYYDQRETGRSARTTSLEGDTLRTLVDDADALRAHLDLNRFILFGHSFGGCLALAYALQYGERLDGLILCATPPNLDHVPAALESVTARASPAQKAVMSTLFSKPTEDDAALKDAWTVLLPLYFAHYQPEFGEAMLGRMRCSATAWNHLGRLAADLSANAKHLSISCPVLLLEGAADWFTPEEQVNRLTAALPQAKLSRFDHSGHFPFAEEKDRFIAIVRAWLMALR